MIFLYGVTLFACDDGPVSETGVSDYLPLEVGNSWTFEVGAGSNKIVSFKTVTRKVDINGHSYFEIVSSHGASNPVIDDTTYYRIDGNLVAYVYRMNISEEMEWFRLNGSDGDTWSFTTDDNETDVTLSVIDLVIGSHELKDCKSFYYDVEQYVDEEHSIALGKGIGFVQFNSAWVSGIRLTSAVINGHEIHL